MKLAITLDQSGLRLELVKNGKVIDSETALYYHNLSDVLITLLDKLLKRNNIDATVLNSCKIQGNAGDNSTSYKMVAAFIEGLKVKT